MSTPNESDRQQPPGEGRQPACKRPYHKPAFRCEAVFETMALRCGKVQATQAQCKQVRKNS